MIVVIILTTIVVGMAFSVLTLVQKHMYGIQNNFSKHTEIRKLEQSLWLDFNRYSKITYHDLNNTLVFATAIDSVSYHFTDTSIIKDVDTFNIVPKQKLLFFDGHKTKKGYVDALKIVFPETLQDQMLFISKQNDAVPYVNTPEAIPIIE